MPPSASPTSPPVADEPRGSPPAYSSGWALLPLVLLGVFTTAQFFTGGSDEPAPLVAYSAFYDLIEAGAVQSVALRADRAEGKLRAPQPIQGHPATQVRTVLPAQRDEGLLPLLRDKKVEVFAADETQSPLVKVALAALPWILVLGFWLWMSRRASRLMGDNPIAGLLRGRRRRFDQEAQVKVRFDDVAGLSGPKRDLEEVVSFLREPERFRRLGGTVPRGVLLVGPPGTGKTLLARAVAGEAGAPFFSINGSEFIEMFVGMGASRVRELFAEAKKVAPCIVFIDEIDAVGRTRGPGLGLGNDEREQTLNQLLVEMDGFLRNDLVIVLAATNRPDVLDPAILRPGRFDRRVFVDRPELSARKAILDVHVRGKTLADDVDLGLVAATTPGFSGADLANLTNEAALGATRRGADAIERQDFRAAYDKIVLGDPTEAKLDEAEKRRVAVHESGHAIVAHFTPRAEPLDRVSILPRGMALGVTQQAPTGDRHLLSQPELEARLRVLMGGYAAERVVLGDGSSGAENDLKKATEIAFKMVAHYGMSERVGPLFIDQHSGQAFFGQALGGEGASSDATARLIEQETTWLLARAVEAATSTIQAHRGAFDRLFAHLLTHETAEPEELGRLLGPPFADAELEGDPG